MPGGTPYITPAMLTAAPAGIAWTVVPRLTADTAQQMAQLLDVCWKATSIVDTYCRQPLRAIVNTETGRGPGEPRFFVDRATGIGKLITRRSPVTSALALLVAQAQAFPPDWTAVPATKLLVGKPVITNSGPTPETGPSGGNVVEVAPGNLVWWYGRGGQRFQLSTVAGWPHTSLTEAANQDATELQVDDVTGWATPDGFTGFAYDSVLTEGVTVTDAAATDPPQLPNGAGAVQAGPGTLTLAEPLANAHEVGTVVSAMPQNAIHAAVLAATVLALEGIDAIATQSQSGQMAGSSGALAQQYEYLLDDFRNWG